ncbi:DUF4129 domain-containing protein [Virgibacillus flavescens]|uniref:DUF4129 domain-containing protein n=1 Tax=Virgibacillus flavescens TaxID=1611422 RepID=UPI003D3579B3
MKPNNTITKYYQFTCDYLLFYFFLVPILSLVNYSITIWDYFLAAIISIVLITVSVRLLKKYVIYVIDFFIIVFLMYYLIGLPLIISSILASFTLWRFIVHNNNLAIEKQFQSMGYMLLLFAVDLLYFYDSILIWMALIYFFVMIMGYQLSHILTGDSDNLTKSLHFPIGFTGIILAGSVIVFSFFQFANFTLTSIWNNVVELFILDWDPPIGEQKAIAESPATSATERDIPIPGVFNWVALIAFGLVVIAIIIFLARKKVFHRVKSSRIKAFASTAMKENEREESSKRNSFLNRKFSRKPTNRIRLKVYKFEKLAARKGKGRKHSETIEEWFNRYNLETTYLNLYQKVRYGDGELTEDEALQLQAHLAEIKGKMKL